MAFERVYKYIESGNKRPFGLGIVKMTRRSLIFLMRSN